jgi:hypothetical protein
LLSRFLIPALLVLQFSMWGVVGDNICVLSSMLMRMIRSCHLAALCRAPENQLLQNDINGDRLHCHVHPFFTH